MTEQRLRVAFANIDWKEGRHGKNFSKHATALGRTVNSIARDLAPAVLCLCEVGEVRSPLSTEHMQDLESIICANWPAAQDHGLQFLYTVGEPYLTAYRPDLVSCTNHCILNHLYVVRGGDRRTAQHFLLAPKEGNSPPVNVLNVHAPSGQKTLTRKQRGDLLASLLKAESLRRDATHATEQRALVGHDRFIIGGDMNTSSVMLNALLFEAQPHHLLPGSQASRRARIWSPVWGKHGDVGIAGGVAGEPVNENAKNHNPNHVPYAFCWHYAADGSSETDKMQSSAAEPRALHPNWLGRSHGSRGSSSPGAASGLAAQREQSRVAPGTVARRAVQFELALPGGTAQQRAQQTQPFQRVAAPVARTWHVAGEPRATAAAAPQREQPRATPDLIAEPAAQSQQPRSRGTTREWAQQTQSSLHAPASAATGARAAEKPFAATAPTTEQASQPAAAAGGNCDSAASTSARLASAAAHAQDESCSSGEDKEDATEHVALSPEDAEAEVTRRDHAQYPIAIVEAFLGPSADDEAEDVILDVVGCVNDWASGEDLKEIAEMFSPIFFYFPHGLKNRTVFEPRDAPSFVRAWKWLAEFRTEVDANPFRRHCVRRLPRVVRHRHLQGTTITAAVVAVVLDVSSQLSSQALQP